MKFLNQRAIDYSFKEEVFAIANDIKEAKAKVGNENVYNGSIGTLLDEEEKLITFNSVYNLYNQLPFHFKAKYAANVQGNDNYLKAVNNWVFKDKITQLEKYTIATVGGTGAIALSFLNHLDSGQTILLPSINWGNYAQMGRRYGLKVEYYSLFKDDKFNLDAFELKCQEIIKKQGKVLVVINDPCHNPTGYSLTYEEWEKTIRIINNVALEGEVILLNDIAYLDYANDSKKSHDYFTLFNEINENVLINVAFSCSKTLTAYGLRLGALIALSKDTAVLTHLQANYELTARTLWSNSPNGAMELFSLVTKEENLNLFLQEKQKAIELLKMRSSAFINEAQKYNLPLYPYKEGFFITLIVEDKQKKEKLISLFIKNNLFFLKVDLGIRIGISGLSINKCLILPQKIHNIIKTGA